MNITQLKAHVIVPTLIHIGLHSEAAVELVLGTAIQESHLEYLKQLGRGPAVGIYQMEPATHDDIWRNYLAYKPDLAEKVRALELPGFAPGAAEMCGNLYYATAMCRVHYLRVPKKLPPTGDINAMALYWKQYYNTPLGKGTVTEYIHNWKKMTRSAV